ncbi:MAG: patatin-like phospholipase family protein [Actinomycetota bacterium]
MASSPERISPVASALATVRRRLPGRRKIAFVFSGGGNLGAVQVGMLRALAETGVRPDVIVGCSVGAINGAGFAAEPNLDGVERLDRIWRRIAAGEPDLMPSRLIPIVAQLARKGQSLHDPQTLADLLDEELVAKTFDGLAIPFQCVATDLESATEHWFDRGRLVPALLASAALPAVYPAFRHGDRTFIDGGVLNEVHAARAVALGATELYVLHVGHLEGRTLETQRPFDGLARAYWTARRFRMEEDLGSIPGHCVVHRLPAGSKPRLRFDDFSQAGELADLAYQATAQYLRTGHSPSPVAGPVSEPEPDFEDEQDEQDGPDGTNGGIGVETRAAMRLRLAESRLAESTLLRHWVGSDGQ